MDINVDCLPFMFSFAVVVVVAFSSDGSLWKVKQAIELGQFTDSHKRHINLNKSEAEADCEKEIKIKISLAYVH
jgi:hypothetical protein